jgi:cold shock CspA family protein
MREQGAIKKFVVEKGYGFIGRPGCADVFFHQSELGSGAVELIREGMHVEFTVAMDERGRLRAVGVEVLA